jgi:competence protein ComEC
MLYFFNRFSLIGPVMNLLVEPLLCFWALPLGLAAIPFIFISPDIAVWLLQIGGYGIQAGQYLVHLGSGLSFASLWTITPGYGEIIIYISLLILWPMQKTSLYHHKIIAAAALLLFVHFTWGILFPEKPTESKISYLDVGQGSASFLHLPDGTRLLIDGGGSRRSSLNAGERIIAPCLWKKRIWRLDSAVISHPHSDHFNGMEFILRHFKPKTLYINGDRRGEGNYDALLQHAHQLGIAVDIPGTGDVLVQGKDFNTTVLGMNGLKVRTNAPVNDRCLVLKYSTGKRAFLFPADISNRSEALLLQSAVSLKADVLLAPHHGSATSNSSSFIAAVGPSIIIVSAGKGGKAHYPAPANLAAWKAQGITTYITREQGTITCSTDGSRLQCSTFVQQQ